MKVYPGVDFYILKPKITGKKNSLKTSEKRKKTTTYY